MKPHYRRAMAAAMAMALSLPAMADPARPSRELEVRLYNCIVRGAAPAEPASLIMVVRQHGDKWDKAWGVARDIGVWVNEAALSDVRFSDKQFDFTAEVVYETGRGTYQVKLAREGDLYKGTYSGTFGGREVKGGADATVAPPHHQPAADFRPAAPGEHPRILFRKSDIPRLQQRAQTPMGKAAMAKLAGPIGLGVTYQLTGDKELPASAMKEVEVLMAKGHQCDQFGNNLGDRLEKVSLAYDLFHGVWPEDFKRRVEAYMAWAANCAFQGRRDMGSGINWNIVSNWSSPIYTGAAFAGLALWGEKGPEPARPAAPCGGGEVAPAKDYKPGKEVPVTRFVSGRMPDDWVCVAGLKLDAGQDGLQSIGGAAAARPEVGTVVKSGGKEFTFALLSHEKGRGYYATTDKDGIPTAPEQIDMTAASNKAWFTTGYYYTVIDNDHPRWVRLDLGGNGAAYLAGTRLTDGECVHLAGGMCPLMVEGSIDWTAPWGRHLLHPRLTEVTADEAQAATAATKQRHDAELRRWQRDADQWKAEGGQSVAFKDIYERGRHNMYVFAREAVGTGGMQGEVSHYSQIATHPPMRYNAAHRQMFGYDCSSREDLTMVVPRKMMAYLFREGRPLVQETNGYPELDCAYFSSGYPVAKEQWKPALLWAWNYIALLGKGGKGGKGSGDATDPAAAAAEADPLGTLLAYPLETAPREPKGIMPLTWQAVDMGQYVFRNGWTNRDDCIVQVFLKAHTISGWNGPNAGTFRVQAFGTEWAVGPHDRSRCRWEECVVMLPENPEINQGACSRATYYKAEDDGSGSLSIDMDDVYSARSGERARLYERYGNIRQGGWVNSGIKGMRAIAVDYSGKSGAPCLLAIADKISGGKSRIWTWQLARPSAGDRGGAGADPGDLSRTKVDDATFTIAKNGGYTLKGTFVTRHSLSAKVREESMIGAAAGVAGKEIKKPIHGVFAEGGDDFFVIVTIQKGDAPRVKVEGSGLDAEVTIGSRKVKFDGQKILLGQ